MEFMDEESIRNAVEVEKRRLAVEAEKRRLAVEELVKKKKLTKEELEQIRDMRMKFVRHISPLEIIEKGDEDFIDDDVVPENVNQIELVIHVIYHYYIYQYWSPPPRTTTSAAAAVITANSSSSSSSSLACQHHDYHHPRDDDDEDMMIASCRPLCDPPQKFKIILRAAAISDDDDDDHTALLGDLDAVLFEHNVVIRTCELEDLKRGIAHSISEAKAAHVLMREKPLPKRVRICCDVSRVAKLYFGSAEAATFVAVEDDAEEASASHAYFSSIFD